MPAPCDLEEKRRKLEMLSQLRLELRGGVFRQDGHLMIRAYCNFCKNEREYSVNNLEKGKTTGCVCQRRVKHRGKPMAKIFGERFDAIKQRCNNPRSSSYRWYGGRGIRCEFLDRDAFVCYMLELVAKEYPQITSVDDLRKYEIDRTDNDDNYKRGNLRLVSAFENISNSSRIKHTTYRGTSVVALHLYYLLKNHYPDLEYSHAWISKLALSGLTGEEILERAALRRKGGRKATRFVPERLEVLSLYGVCRQRRKRLA